jgi:HEPN domain-containing protein
MKSREQVIREFVHGWLEKAEHDLCAADVLLSGSTDLGDAIAFHSQQAAEKLMKAYLVRHQVEFTKTHDLMLLRLLIGKMDKKLAEKLAFADGLTPYAVEFRYPGVAAEVDRTMAEQAFADAQRVRELILAALQEYLRGASCDSA